MYRAFGRMSRWETKLAFNHEWCCYELSFKIQRKSFVKGKELKLAVPRIWDTELKYKAQQIF